MSLFYRNITICKKSSTSQELQIYHKNVLLLEGVVDFNSFKLRATKQQCEMCIVYETLKKEKKFQYEETYLGPWKVSFSLFISLYQFWY